MQVVAPAAQVFQQQVALFGASWQCAGGHHFLLVGVFPQQVPSDLHLRPATEHAVMLLIPPPLTPAPRPLHSHTLLLLLAPPLIFLTTPLVTWATPLVCSSPPFSSLTPPPRGTGSSLAGLPHGGLHWLFIWRRGLFWGVHLCLVLHGNVSGNNGLHSNRTW